MNVFLNVFNELFHLFVIICYAVCKLLNGFAGYFLRFLRSFGMCFVNFCDFVVLVLLFCFGFL